MPTVELAVPGFHARFSATWRRYRYRILNRRARRPDRSQVWHLPGSTRASRRWRRRLRSWSARSFNSSRSVACGPTWVETLDLLTVERNGEEIDIEVGARSFLHNQVRVLVGTLQLVGRGRWPA